MTTDHLRRAQELVAADLAKVERLMAVALHSRSETISRVSNHLLTSGGKRIRAILCLLAGRATDSPMLIARRLACCAELIHAASLCHDDVIDSGQLRRGQPTVRALFGNPMSILLGDYCLAQAFRLMAEEDLGRAGAAAANVVTAMAEGEVVQAESAQPCTEDVDRYFAVAEAKTGSLLIWCASLGGLVAPPYRKALETYGRLLGRVYQIADDLLDFETDDRSGKAAGQDLLGGESTLPLLLACAARPDLASRVEALRSSSTHTAAEIDSLTASIRDTGAFDKARQRALAEAENAAAALHALPDSKHRTMLAELARYSALRHA